MLQSIYKSYTFTHLFNLFTNILVFTNIFTLLTEVKLSLSNNVIKNLEFVYVARFKQVVLCLKYDNKYLNALVKISK